MFASANDFSSKRTRRRRRSNSFISSGFSTRILLPRFPLPYFRTQFCTVVQPRIPYFRRTCAKGKSCSSSSLTTPILNDSLYRIPWFCPTRFAIRGDNLGQDGTPPSSVLSPLSSVFLPRRPLL